ncbi:hypothetical protein ACLKA6_002597 [Drosophila palustris]
MLNEIVFQTSLLGRHLKRSFSSRGRRLSPAKARPAPVTLEDAPGDEKRIRPKSHPGGPTTSPRSGRLVRFADRKWNRPRFCPGRLTRCHLAWPPEMGSNLGRELHSPQPPPTTTALVQENPSYDPRQPASSGEEHTEVASAIHSSG